MPGTALVIGVRKPAGGAIRSRSVCGVNANGGSAGSELLGGVVAGFAVVRSVLSKQVGSAIPAWRRFSRRSHRTAAEAAMLPEAKTVRPTMFNTKTIERYIEVPPVFMFAQRREPIRAAPNYNEFRSTGITCRVDGRASLCSPSGFRAPQCAL